VSVKSFSTNFQGDGERFSFFVREVKSGGGPPQSKTLARSPMMTEPREASWSAPDLWRFEKPGTMPANLVARIFKGTADDSTFSACRAGVLAAS
jgi:hypothetical protein